MYTYRTQMVPLVLIEEEKGLVFGRVDRLKISRSVGF